MVNSADWMCFRVSKLTRLPMNVVAGGEHLQVTKFGFNGFHFSNHGCKSSRNVQVSIIILINWCKHKLSRIYLLSTCWRTCQRMQDFFICNCWIFTPSPPPHSYLRLSVHYTVLFNCSFQFSLSFFLGRPLQHQRPLPRTLWFAVEQTIPSV